MCPLMCPIQPATAFCSLLPVVMGVLVLLLLLQRYNGVCMCCYDGPFLPCGVHWFVQCRKVSLS